MNLEFNKKTHQYFIKNKELISVSRILDKYFGNSYKNVPKEILEKAILRGNAVHKCLELYFKNINSLDIVNKIKNLIKNKKSFTPIILNYCNTALDSLNSFCLGFNEFNKINNLIIEKPFAYDIVAGTPDLLINEILIDYKTYKNMTKQLRLKSELQLTAYYWLLIKNGIKVKKEAYICWIQQNKTEFIKVEITDEKINEWEIAIYLYKKKYEL